MAKLFNRFSLPFLLIGSATLIRRLRTRKLRLRGRTTTKRIKISLLFSLLCATTGIAQLTGATYTSIRQVDFRNFTYRVAGFVEQPFNVRLRNGSYVEQERGLRTYSVRLHKLVFGDLTGDGGEEAAVVLVVSGGGSGFVTEGTVYTLRSGRPVRLSDFEGGEGGHSDSIQTVSIVGGLLNVEHVDGSGNPHTIRYRWDGRSFVEVGARSEQSLSETNRASSNVSETRYFLRLFSCDDGCAADVWGGFIRSTRLGEDSGWIDFTDLLQDGRNPIKFSLENEGGAIAYGFQIRKNQTMLFEQICGRAGVVGCDNNRTYPRGC